MTARIRDATPADIEAIARLHADSWQRTYRGVMRDDFLDGPVVEDRLQTWQQRLNSPDGNQYVIVAEDAGAIAGFLCAFGESNDRWGTLVDNLHVRHDAQAQGIGRALMRECAAWAIARYPDRGIYLWVAQKNLRAQRVYERLGGANVETLTHEQHGGGEVDSFRIAWPDPRVLLAPARERGEA